MFATPASGSPAILIERGRKCVRRSGRNCEVDVTRLRLLYLHYVGSAYHHEQPHDIAHCPVLCSCSILTAQDRQRIAIARRHIHNLALRLRSCVSDRRKNVVAPTGNCVVPGCGNNAPVPETTVRVVDPEPDAGKLASTVVFALLAVNSIAIIIPFGTN